MNLTSTHVVGVFSESPAPLMAEQPTTATAAKSFSVGAVRAALSTNQAGWWDSDHRLETEKYVGWHYVAIRAIALQAAQATVSVYDDKAIGQATAKMRRDSIRKIFGSVMSGRAKSQAAENEPAAKPLPEDHRLVKLMKRPNPQQSGAMFRYEQTLQLGLTGTCLVVKIPNQVRQTVERYVVPTAVAMPRPPSRDMPRGGFYINPAAANQWATRMDAEGFVESWGFNRLLGMTFPVESFLIVRWPHPLLKSDGQSPVSAGALWTDTAEMVDRSRHSHLKNGPDPSLAITGPENADLDEAGLTRAAVGFNQKYGGPGNTGKAAFFNHGTTVEPLSTTPKDMVYELGFNQMRDATLAIHGVPPMAAGIVSPTGREGLYAPLLQFSLLTVQPMLSIIAEEETIQQAPEFGQGLTVEIEAATVDDPGLLEQSLQTDIAAGARTINEHRATRGLVAVPWGEARVGGVGFGRADNQQQQGQPQGGATAGVDPAAAESALNGAQITAAVDVMNQVASGGLSAEAGIELLVAVGIDRQRAAGMIQSNSGTTGGGVDAEGKPISSGQQPPPGGEFGDTSRLQWKRNIKAIRDVMDGLKDGSFSEVMAVEMLQSLGMPAERAQRLVDDAKDGMMDEAENQALLNGSSKSHKSNGHAKELSSDDKWMAAAVGNLWRR